MRITLATRAARAFAAATLVFSLSLAPSYARMGGGSGAGFARPVFGGGHFSRFATRGFNRGFDFNRFGFNRFGPGRFDHFGFNRFGPNRFDRFGFNRFGPNRFNRFGFNRFNRFGSNRFDGNQLLIGGGWGGWGWDGWGGVPVSTGASEPIIIGGGPPVIVNVGAGAGPGDAGGGYEGGCVTHKLIYDDAGKYVGEHQTSQC